VHTGIDTTLHRQTVGISDMAISKDPRAELITHALGSCLGVTAYDPVACIGGLIHIMLPMSKIAPEKAKDNPLMFVDSGIPFFFKELFAAGAHRENIELKVAGGAQVLDTENSFKIGERNFTVLRKLMWKNDLLIASEDVGGNKSRTMTLHMGNGKVLIKSPTGEKEL
jgi:chemotaxis protein CheD